MTASTLIDDHQNAYRDFWGEEPPAVRKRKGGIFEVQYRDGPQLHAKDDFMTLTALMKALKGNADA